MTEVGAAKGCFVPRYCESSSEKLQTTLNPHEEELEGNRDGFPYFPISVSPQALGLSECV